MKKIKILFAAAIFCATAFVGYYAYNQATMTDQERLTQANIEALSEIEATTTWTCVGSDKRCKISCGICGTSINSRGTLTGYHTCSL